MRIHRVVVAAAPLLAVLLAGCAKEYAFTPPATAEGRACVERCQGSQLSCRRDQDQRADAAREKCEAENDWREAKCETEATVEYLACLKFAKTDADRATCQKKSCERPSCTSSPSYGLCDSDYRACYENCGGKVEVRD